MCPKKIPLLQEKHSLVVEVDPGVGGEPDQDGEEEATASSRQQQVHHTRPAGHKDKACTTSCTASIPLLLFMEKSGLFSFSFLCNVEFTRFI